MNEHMLSFSGIDRVQSSIMTRTTNTPHRIHKRYLPVQLLVTYFAQHSIHAPTQRVLPQSQQHQTGHIRQSHPEPTLVAPILSKITPDHYCKSLLHSRSHSNFKKLTMYKEQDMYVLRTPYCIRLMDQVGPYCLFRTGTYTCGEQLVSSGSKFEASSTRCKVQFWQVGSQEDQVTCLSSSLLRGVEYVIHIHIMRKGPQLWWATLEHDQENMVKRMVQLRQ